MFGIYGVSFFAPGENQGGGGLGNPWLYFDAISDKPAGAEIPGTGSAGARALKGDDKAAPRRLNETGWG